MNKKIKKEANKQAKKAYRKIRKTKYFPIIVALLVLAFIIYVIIPEKPKNKTPKFQDESIIHYEIPKTDFDEEVISHKAYTLGYNEETEQPNWVAYTLSKDNLLTPVTEREGDFREDDSVSTKSATLKDYRSSGYDRGHLAPAADFKWDKEAMDESFYLSNMSPQVGDFNRGVWADLESAVRSNAYENEFLYVTTGPIFTKRPYTTIGTNKVAVPDAYYKALLVYNGNNKKAIGFVLPNEKGDKPLVSYAVSIDELEDLTDIDFFYQLDDDDENRIEKSFNPKSWSYSKFHSPTVQESADGDYERVTKANSSSSGSFKFKATMATLRGIKHTLRSIFHLN